LHDHKIAVIQLSSTMYQEAPPNAMQNLCQPYLSNLATP